MLRLRKRSWAIVLFLAVMVVVIGPYVVARIRSEATAVSVQRLAEHAVAHEFDGTIRVGCFNIAHGRGPVIGESNWGGGSTTERLQRLRAIGELLNAQSLDVVVLNEVDFDAVWSGGHDQARVVADAGQFPFIVRQRNIDVSSPVASLRYGNAIVSRFPVRDTRLVRFPAMSRLERIVAGNHDSVIATVQLPDGGVVDVWALHLESRDAGARKRAAARIARVVTEHPRPLVLAGDFNSEAIVSPDAESNRDPSAIEALLALEAFQAYPSPAPDAPGTFPSSRPSRTIDWVLVPREWHLVNGRVIETSLSDHLPVATTLAAPGR